MWTASLVIVRFVLVLIVLGLSRVVSLEYERSKKPNFVSDGISTASVGLANWTLTTAPYGLAWDGVVSSSTGQYLVSSASKNGIYVSTDFGETWIQTLANSTYKWYPLAISSSGQYICAIAINSGIFHSDSYGATWTQVVDAESNRAIAIASDSTGQRLVYAQYSGSIFLSTDYGSTWQASSAPMGLSYLALASNAKGSQLMAAVDGGTILISMNYGASWASSGAPQSQLWISVTCDSTGQYIAAAVSHGNIYVSSTYGSTWEETSLSVQTGQSYAWLSIRMNEIGQQIVAAAGEGGPMYISQDFGATWDLLSPVGFPAGQSWFDVSCDATGQYLVAVSYLGGVYTYRLPSATSCAAGTGKSDGYLCQSCGCNSYNDGSSLYCEVCPSNTLSYPPHDSCTKVCSYPFLMTLEESCSSTTSDIDYICHHLSLHTPRWVLLLIIIFTAVLLIVNLYVIHTKILKHLPGHTSRLRALHSAAASTSSDSHSPPPSMMSMTMEDGIPMTERTTSLPSIQTASIISNNNSLTSSSSSTNQQSQPQPSRRFTEFQTAAAYDASFYLRVAFRTAVPALDMMSDLLYILSSTFYDSTIFALCIVAFLHPLVFIARDFWRLKDSPKALPRFYLLPIPAFIW